MIKINPISENALVCTLEPPAHLEKQQKLWAFADHIQDLNSVAEVVVGMNNVTVFMDYGADLTEFSHQLEHIWGNTQAAHYQGKHVDIPVIYGGEFGMDLADVAQYHHVSIEKIVEEHTKYTYTVFMMGFQAGFPYLGGLPEHLHTPRHDTPRTRVEAGSVGIGGAQTGVYPFASPAGWQILGRTHLPLFDANATPPTVLSAGDTVRFVAEKIEK
ncbi:5-oxoprolinase subunit PxpB [Alysiella filiformis]|uniref:Sensor histidine kinase inhibitor, KipI family n=2 Tax=Alysiella TaxID=194195 RepID=A0A286E535_9NEIS|nr:5-oxoprolinase subunit PxpB [Alysiella filiformis]QMT30420.1 5-oxoprolinase subunit PxpB [Alysiella filiformis]UBQ56598.1 5-oxoprolinase subunit PxpB [Alysiella filiformis DSM 16848]SOD66020.1 sensor histidine kinase inhibitor, KipI family [Alysiella filiformis DSM 16848]